VSTDVTRPAVGDVAVTDVTIRPAQEKDLDALADYEVVIAQVSFGDTAVDDPAVHRRKLAKALERDAASMFVAVDDADRPIGWLWLAANTNFLTQERYANLRSLAVTPGEDSDRVAEALLRRGIRYAREHDLDEITGKVHVSNVKMRVLYRRVGLEPVSLTMRARLGADGLPDDAADGPA